MEQTTVPCEACRKHIAGEKPNASLETETQQYVALHVALYIFIKWNACLSVLCLDHPLIWKKALI